MGGSENRKASAGNGAELNRMVTIKTGGDHEQGGENKAKRKITRDLDNLVQQHESHQNYIDRIKKMNLDKRKGNKTQRNNGSLNFMFNSETSYASINIETPKP